MKILIIGPIPIFLGGREYGGICKHISGLAKELHKKEHEVTLWNYKPFKTNVKTDIGVIQNSYWSFFLAFVLCGHYLFSSKIACLSIRHKFMFIYQVFKLEKILKNNRFDVIHVHSLTNTVSIALQEISCNVPFVITDHGFWNQKGAMIKGSNTFKRIRKSVAACKYLIFISAFAKSKHSKIDFGQKNKLIKIKNPLHIPDKFPLKNNDKPKKVIFFNGLTESVKIKNLPILLEAIERNDYLKDNIKLIAITNDEGKHYISTHTYNFDIEVYGKSSWEKVIAYYQASNLLVVPSKSDSFGLVYLEALMYGVPIIGLDKLINEFQSDLNTYIGEGFDSNVDSHNYLAKKIMKVLNSKDFSYDKVYEQLKETYSWKNNINKYEEVYKKVIE